MKIGNRNVVANGALVTHSGDTEIQLVHGDLTFILTFVKGEGEGTVKGDSDGKVLKLRFSDFDNSLGIAWHSEVGTVAGKKLHLAIYVWTVGESEKIQRTINYTLSVEGA